MITWLLSLGWEACCSVVVCALGVLGAGWRFWRVAGRNDHSFGKRSKDGGSYKEFRVIELWILS